MGRWRGALATPVTLLGIGGMVLGQKLGLRVGGKLNAGQLRKAVYGYVLLSGIVTVVRNLG